MEIVRRKESHEQVVATLGPGEGIGEFALRHASEQTAIARAREVSPRQVVNSGVRSGLEKIWQRLVAL